LSHSMRGLTAPSTLGLGITPVWYKLSERLSWPQRLISSLGYLSSTTTTRLATVSYGLLRLCLTVWAKNRQHQPRTAPATKMGPSSQGGRAVTPSPQSSVIWEEDPSPWMT